MRVLFVVIAASLLACCSAFVDECSQFQTCETCLNVSAASNTRQNCGWCHVGIIYSDGTQGARCADIRDKPWKCPDMYETYYCSAGFVCNFSTGTCHQSSTPGEGFGNITDCQQHCFNTPDTYLCNTTSYQCQKCQFGDPRCSDKSSACANCQQPPGMFKCVKNSTNSSGECTYCQPSEPNCTDFKTACSNCFSPQPPPPPPPPPPPQKQYTCNTTSLQCEEAKQGSVIEACNQQCTNSTPSNIVGVWRGIEAQKGFILGEWDYNFTNTSVTIRDPSGTITHGTVSVINNMVITLIDGPHKGSKINVLVTEMSYGPETLTSGFSLSDYDSPVPDSIADAFDGVGKARVHILSRCHAWKTSTCDFSSVFAPTRAAIPPMYRPYKASPGWLEGASGMFRAHPETHTPVAVVRRGQVEVMHDPDPCNRFLTCATCIGHREGPFQCGWCMGGTVSYNDTGDSGLHCAGFIASQPALPFSCPLDFRTDDCSGWTCNYTVAQPTCVVTEDGTYSSQSTCEATCKSAEFARCNQGTKQCEPCAQGEPDCRFTKDECQQSCALQLQICNYTTKQCQNCDKLTTPNCTQSAGECSYNCQHDSHGICNPLTGQCESCDPTKGQPGCADQCNATCQRSLNFECDNATMTCQPGKGNQTLQDCAKSCSNHTQTNYGCDWTNATAPQCVAGKGTQSLSDCAQNCHAMQYAKCNPVTGQCESCQQGPDCQYTVDYCKASCQKSNLLGVWRGIQINKGFKVAEYDFTFYPDGKVAFVSTINSSAVYEAQFNEGGTSKEGRPIIFVITKASDGGPLPIQMNNNLRGLFTVTDGEEGITRFLNLGLGLNLNPAVTFDDAMTKMEFVLVSCKSATHCDFTAAKVPE